MLGQGWFPALQLHFVNSCVLLTVVFQRHCSMTLQPLGQMGLGRSTTVLQPEAELSTLVPGPRQLQSSLALHSHIGSSSSSSRVYVSSSLYDCHLLMCTWIHLMQQQRFIVTCGKSLHLARADASTDAQGNAACAPYHTGSLSHLVKLLPTTHASAVTFTTR